MAENKSQHFVPRFYLAHFSSDGGNRFHLFHVARQEVRTNVGIRDQCAANYFYGKDLKIEKAFMELESVVAGVLREVLAGARLPVAGSEGDLVLRTHVALQWGRTRSHTTGQHEMTARMVKTAFGGNTKGKTRFEEEMEAVTLEDSTRMSVEVSADCAAFIGDLESKLIDANGHGEFVTSDAPVVMANPHYLGHYPGGVTGLGVEGLVLLVPLSPRYLAIYYDRSCYRVGSPHQRTVAVSGPADVAALNNFQCLNADAVVYFQNELFGSTLAAEYSKVRRLRPEDRHVVRMAVATGPEGPKEIIHSYRADVNYRPRLGFFSTLRKRKGVRESVDQIPTRDPRLQDLFHEYREEVRAGLRDRSFLRFMVEQSGTLVGSAVPTSTSRTGTVIRALESLVGHHRKQ